MFYLVSFLPKIKQNKYKLQPPNHPKLPTPTTPSFNLPTTPSSQPPTTQATIAKEKRTKRENYVDTCFNLLKK